MRRRSAATSLLAAAALSLATVSTALSWPEPEARISIRSVPGNGMTAFPRLDLNRNELAALPQQRASVTIEGVSHSESGPTLSSLLGKAGLQYISECKNDELRYWLRARNESGESAVLTAGEIDALFGGNQAIVSIEEDGHALDEPRLIMLKDTTGARDLQRLWSISIGRAAPQLADNVTPTCTAAPFTPPVSPTPAKGSVVINGDVAHPMTLSYAQLEALPQVSQEDTYIGHGVSTIKVTGPTLFDVLAAAEPRFRCYPNDDRNFYVEVTSSEDGYASLASWVDIDPAYNGKQMLLALTENGASTLSSGSDPRLTAPGDAHGGRYVYGAAVITVFRAPGDGWFGECGLRPMP